MKPGKRDIKINFLIQGKELVALHNISFLLSECFGLDARIDNYKGKRPIGLYQWDFECLLGGIEYALNADASTFTNTQKDRNDLVSLFDRMKKMYQQTYRTGKQRGYPGKSTRTLSVT